MDRAREPEAPSVAPEGPTTAAPAQTGGQQQLLGLQRSAGNQAVVAMLQRRPDVIRRDGGAATAEAAAPTGDAAAIANPGQYLRDAGAKWDDIRQRYRDGQLGWTAGGDHEGTLNPGGLGMNALSAFRLQTTVLKEEHNRSGAPPSVIQRVLPSIEAAVAARHAKQQEEMKGTGITLPPPAPLKWNYGAGSGTATSDIDVNLSGDGTEVAVEKFNDLFRKEWGGKESGTVFDVNVYASDYLPSTGGVSLIRAREAVEKREADVAAPGAIEPGAEGWTDRKVQFETSLTKGSAAAKEASGKQEEFSLLKTRKDLSEIDWKRYKLEQIAAFGADTVARDAKIAAFTKAEELHRAREKEIADKIAELDAAAAKLLAESGKPPPAPPVGADKEDAAAAKRLEAENRLYEEKLVVVADRRGDLKVARAKEASISEIEAISMALKAALHEAAKYANEAYITGASVLHVVGNLQLLKGSEEISIGLGADDYLASANEQLGFIFDDFHREKGEVDKGLLKAGKYISRLGHAAGKLEAAVAKAVAARKSTYTPLADPTAQQVQRYGEQVMAIKNVAPDKQKAELAKVSIDGWTLSGKSLQQVKTMLLTFQSKVQALGGKL